MAEGPKPHDTTRVIRGKSGVLPRRIDSGEIPDKIGKFEVIERLGEGGQGTIFRVRNPDLGREEALKIMRPGFAESSEGYQRFEREARALASLQHPAIVPVFEVGQLEGRPYYTMQYIEGDSVGDLLVRYGKLPARIALRIARDAAHALAAAHSRGIVHRDIKPHNLLVTRDDAAEIESRSRERDALVLSTGRAMKFRTLLTDFGVAHVPGESNITLDTNVLLGTLMYMPPEQASADHVNVKEWSDVYALGATMYHMICGEPPFATLDTMALMRHIAFDDPIPISRRVSGLARDIDTIVTKCLEKNPNRRYANARELAEDLDRFLRGEVIRARPATTPYKFWRWVVRNRVAIVSATVSVIAFSVALFFLAGLPYLRRRTLDNASLANASAAKFAIEDRFEDLIAREQYDEAIELARPVDGITPPLPSLYNPSRATEPRYANLRLPYRTNLAEAYRRRGLRRLGEDNPLGRGDLANAYRAGRDVPSGRRAARAALIDLAAALVDAGEIAAAEWTARLAVARFGADSPDAREVFARVFERAGELELAAWYWSRVETPEARAALAALSHLLPRRTVALAPGPLTAVDLDGDGAREIVVMTEGPRLVVYRRVSEAWRESDQFLLHPQVPNLAPRAIRTGHLDGDGREEMIASGGAHDSPRGEIFVVTAANGRLALLQQTVLDAPTMDMQAADWDGDGEYDLIVALGPYARRIEVFHNGRLTDRMELGCDPYMIRTRPGGELVVWLGPWFVEYGFRLVRCVRGADVRRQIASMSEDRFSQGSALWLDDEHLLIAANAGSEELRVLPELLSGFHIVRAGASDFGRAERVGPADALDNGVAGRIADSLIACSTASDVMILDASTREYRLLRLPGGISVHDLDGDGDGEVLRGVPGGVEILGLGEFAPEAPPDSTVAEIGLAGETGVVDELTAAGLYEEAAAACLEILAEHDDPRVRFQLGAALSALGKWAEAAEAYGRAAGEWTIAPEAHMRRAAALEHLRDWTAVAEALEAARSLPQSDPYTRMAAGEALTWARPAAALVERVIWTPESDLAWVCENPFKAARSDSSIASWSTGEMPAEQLGVVFRYDGGPLRARIWFRCDEIDWSTGVRLGIEPLEALDEANRPSPSNGALILAIGALGASDLPVIRAEAQYRGADGTSPPGEFTDDAFRPQPEEEYEAVLEYVPGRPGVLAGVRDSHGRWVVEPVEIHVTFPLARGMYMAGVPASGNIGTAVRRGRISDPSHATRMEILHISVEGATEGTVPAAPEPATAAQWLAAANGRALAGDYDAAEDSYAHAIEFLQDDPHGRARAHLFRALMRLRRDRRLEAESDRRAAITLDPSGVGALLSGRAAEALSSDERAFLSGQPEF